MFRVSLPHLLAAALALVHATAAVTASSPSPQGVHLAFGRDDDSMVVGYMTLGKPEASVVEYRLLDDGPTLHAPGVSSAFVDGGDEKLVRYMHFATLRGLRAGAAYAYRVGDPGSSNGGALKSLLETNAPRENEASFSRWFAFRAKRSKAQVTPSSPLCVLAWCDVGHLESKSAIRAVVREIHGPKGPREYAPGGENEKKNKFSLSVAEDAGKKKSVGRETSETASVLAFPDAMLHCGDLGYDLDSSNGRNGDAFLRDIEPIAAYVPYMVSAGNHERAYNFSHYKARFLMPFGDVRAVGVSDVRADPSRGVPPSFPDSKQHDNHYYSFDLGPVHVVAWNSEAFFYPQYFDAAYADRMYEWLAFDLKSVNRSLTPWVVAHAHRPMYCAESRASNESGESRCDAEKEAARLGIMSSCAGDYAASSCARGGYDVDRAAASNVLPRKRLEVLARTQKRNARSWNVERLLYDHGVDLAFFGHVHDYERYFPVFDEAVEMAGVTTAASENNIPIDAYFQPRATVHVTTGSGGNKEMLDARRVAKEALNGTAYPPTRGRCADVVGSHRAAPWCAFTSGFAPKASRGETSDFTFSRFVVRSDAVLTWEQVSAGDPSDDHEGRPPLVIDAFTIVAPTHGAFARLGPRRDAAAFAAR